MEHRNEYEVVIPLSSLMLPDLKLKNLSTQLRIQWAESNVDILLEPQDGIEDAGELLEFVNKRAWIEDGVQDALKKPGSSLHLYDTSDDTGESQSDASQLSDSGEEPTPTKTLYLLMELCKSTLADELAANRKFSGTEISQIFRATAEGLAYIHSKNLVHADISTDNIFFDFQGVAKIGDFGLAIEDDGISRAIGGKFKYLPPELKSKTMGKVVKKGILTKAFDVYALAVVMVELVYSVTSDMELSKLFETVAENGLFPQQTNMAVGEFDVVRLMLSSNPSDRPPAEEILNMIHVGEAAPASSLSIKTETFIQGEGERGFWSGFPEDLIFQILYRLPINDLFALKLVCKEWNFVISRLCIPRLCPPYPCAPLWGLLCFKDPLSPPDSEEVRDEHLKDPSSEDKLLKFYFRLLYQYTLGTKIFPLRFLAGTIEDHFLPLLPPEDGCDASDIRDCCNGLLLLASSTNRYYVANPVTKQRLLVPRNSHRHDNTNIKSTHSSLVFDPSFSLGFKIVRCVRPAEHSTVTHPMELDIFSSDTGQWSSHVLPLEPHGLYGFEWLRRSVYFNGALYSLSLAMYLVCIDKLIPQPSRNTSSRISKDDSWLDLEAWAIELPDRDLIPRELLPNCCGCIGFSSGCFYYSNRDAQGSSMFVWMLVSKGKNSEWVLIHTISIADDLVLTLLPGPNRVKYWKKFDCFRPRAFLPKDDAMVIAAPELIISYHLKTKLVNELWLPPNPWHCNRKTLQLDGNWIFPFSPCLLLLDTIAATK
ncbi:OLC1v1012115C1 [Oldenlandia corymbosa var. corymbosa]|uniref:OLC1v1012115C1 n=1 Tax=Oldenlandia corymbosa var. corymbosa TaxID=529605 RepID=A0AAV1DXF2_OLDCO|nr:OLC1v1012115C1 [Oldenlandia corymbosa var. corymbosa]